MIVHEYKFAFVHIPKTGGISVTHAIMSPIVGYKTYGQIGKLSKELKFRFEMRGKQKHDFGRNFVSNKHITQDLWDQYYKFAFVRNPWDRAVSEFHWRHQLNNGWAPSKDFDEFLKYCEYRIKDQKNKKNDIYWTHAQPQSDYVTDKNGNVILDKIYRFENLQEDVLHLSKVVGLNIELEKHNSSKHNHYSEYYNSARKDFMYKLYKKDIEMFEYEFDS